MKLATLALSAFVSFSALAQSVDTSGVQILEVESLGGDLSISLNSKSAAAKKGFLLKKMKAKKEAKSLAKYAIPEALKGICRAGSFEVEDLILPEAECKDLGEQMECSFNKVQLRCSEISERKTLEFKLDVGLIQPSSACIEVIQGSYSIDNDIINYCNRIKSKTQFQCVSTLTSYSTIKTLAIRACSVFSSEFSQQVLESYQDRGFEAPSPGLVVILAAANTESEATCIKNKMMLNSLTVQDLEKSCIKDSKLDLDRREHEGLGFVTNPRTLQYKVRGVIGK
jgi:hypothetical protein